MPRPYHSPSSIKLGLDCPFAWALQYIDGNRDPNIEWREEFTELKWDFGANAFVLPRTGEKVTAAQRGSALGLGLHATAERYYDPKRGAPDWNWFPGQVLASGRHLLPEPGAIERVVIEAQIGDEPLPVREHTRLGQPTTAIRVEGILWSGFIDLEAHGGDELRRLGIVAPDGMAVLDYKSTSNIAERALTRDELLRDPQAALYAIAVGRRLGLSSVPERWVYFESKKVRRALPVDVTAELSRAHDVIGPCADLARELDMITNSAGARKNTDSCNKYGNPDRINCRHHVENGGTCDARRRRFGQVVQLHNKKPEIVDAMAEITAEERKANFEKKKAELAAKKAGAAASAPAQEPEPSEPEADAESESMGGEPGIDVSASEPTPEPAPAEAHSETAPEDCEAGRGLAGGDDCSACG
jgi:hypothetical protein